MLLFAVNIAGTRGQESPNELYQTDMFNTSQIFRQDFCAVHGKVDRDELPINAALEGVAIRAVVQEGSFFNMKDGKIDEDYPGLVAVLLDEICRRAGCTWRDTYATHGRPAEGISFTDLLVWGTDTYDGKFHFGYVSRISCWLER
jgi:hypothetical protein